MADDSPPEFEDLGGAATMDPSPPVRWITSKVMSRLASVPAQRKRRARAERARMRRGERHRIDYFHQVDDAYSLLAAQMLPALLDRYDVELHCHVAGQMHDRNFPEPELLGPLGCYDAGLVAPHYGVDFPADAQTPDHESVELAQRILVGVDAKDFSEVAVALGQALFTGDREAIDAQAANHPPVPAEQARQAVEASNANRTRLGHYQGATFHCAPEWYWGPDRIYHLENRLIEYGARRNGNDAPAYPRPAIETGPLKDDGSLTLEFYPSIRSPYSSIIFDPTVDFARAVGLRLDTRPVLPMVMRGTAITRQKGTYIPADAAREAAALGIQWGPMFDPIGDPVRNAYSLFPWASEQGKGDEFLSSFMRRAWFEGVNTNNDRGMRKVVEGAGLDWGEARQRMGDPAWKEVAEANRQAMYAFGSWGVPSYRLLDARGETVVAAWGQDRLWLVSRQVQRVLASSR